MLQVIRICDFYFPGICLKDDIVVGITASGVNHKKAKGSKRKNAGTSGRTGKR